MRGVSLVLMIALTGGVIPGVAIAQAPASTQTTATSASTPSKTAKAAKPAAAMPSDAEIADAKSKGMVWANMNTKVYHKDDAQYGKTKNGKFMTEADAQKAGYRMAKTSPIGQKKGAAASTAAPK